MPDNENINRLYHVLVVDNDGDNLEAFRLNFRSKFNLITAGHASEALAELSEGPNNIAVLVVENRLASMPGLELLSKALSFNPNLVGILISSTADAPTLIAALNSGHVKRFLQKPWKPDDMERAIGDSIGIYHSRQAEWRRGLQIRAINDYLKSEIKETHLYDRVVGANSGLLEVMDQARRISQSAGHVLITGEPGSGRELVARAIHNLSPRSDLAFIKLSISSFSPRELDAELFGIEKSTGSLMGYRMGRLELAHGSSLFINDVADLPIETQVKLTRALTERRFERVGGSRSVSADVRIMAATSKNLDELRAKRQFRDELRAALDIFTIRIPPLRERKEDIPALAQHFVGRFSGKAGAEAMEFEPGAMEILESYHWPGNVAELESVIRRAVFLARNGKIAAENLCFETTAGTAEQLAPPKERKSKKKEAAPLPEKLADIEKEEFINALKKSGGNRSRAAKLLGINRSTMYYRMKLYGLLPDASGGKSE